MERQKADTLADFRKVEAVRKRAQRGRLDSEKAIIFAASWGGTGLVIGRPPLETIATAVAIGAVYKATGIMLEKRSRKKQNDPS